MATFTHYIDEANAPYLEPGDNVSELTNDASYATTSDVTTSIISYHDGTKADKQSITAGTAGTSSATSGATVSVPYVTVTSQGVVSGYGTHTHTISGLATSAISSGTFADARIASASTWNAKQAALVSGTNIKTINGTSILGSGDMSVGGSYDTFTDKFEWIENASHEAGTITQTFTMGVSGIKRVWYVLSCYSGSGVGWDPINMPYNWIDWDTDSDNSTKWCPQSYGYIDKIDDSTYRSHIYAQILTGTIPAIGETTPPALHYVCRTYDPTDSLFNGSSFGNGIIAGIKCSTYASSRQYVGGGAVLGIAQSMYSSSNDMSGALGNFSWTDAGVLTFEWALQSSTNSYSNTRIGFRGCK